LQYIAENDNVSYSSSHQQNWAALDTEGKQGSRWQGVQVGRIFF
jgi:hypothetical protein